MTQGRGSEWTRRHCLSNRDRLKTTPYYRTSSHWKVTWSEATETLFKYDWNPNGIAVGIRNSWKVDERRGDPFVQCCLLDWQYGRFITRNIKHRWYGGTQTGKSRIVAFEATLTMDTWYITPIGSFTPNPFGLHDIANVWEWCSDRFGAYTLPTESGTSRRIVSKEDARTYLEAVAFVHLLFTFELNRYSIYTADYSAYDVGLRPSRSIEYPLKTPGQMIHNEYLKHTTALHLDQNESILYPAHRSSTESCMPLIWAFDMALTMINNS